MATRYWLGKQAPVSQVDTVTVGGTLSDETFVISIDGVQIVSILDTDNDVDTVRTNLVTAWNLSTVAYATGITAAEGGTGELTLTADVGGLPFTIDLNTPGGSATFSKAATTAADGPNFWDTAENWSGDTIPGTGDTVVLRNSAIPICWNIDQNALAIDRLVIESSFTGRVGINRNVLAISADAISVDNSAADYREDYLRIDVDTVEIGGTTGPGRSNGSTRIKIDNTKTSGASTTTIFSTAATSIETGLPAVRLLYANSDAELRVRSTSGGVGVACDEPAETSTIGTIALSGNSSIYIGEGTTLTTFEQEGGTASLRSAGTIATVRIYGGSVTTEGDYTITLLEIFDGSVIANHIKTGGVAVTTLDLEGGVIDCSANLDDRTFTNVNLKRGGSLVAHAEHLTITNLNNPTDGKYSLLAQDA